MKYNFNHGVFFETLMKGVPYKTSEFNVEIMSINFLKSLKVELRYPITDVFIEKNNEKLEKYGIIKEKEREELKFGGDENIEEKIENNKKILKQLVEKINVEKLVSLILDGVLFKTKKIRVETTLNKNKLYYKHEFQYNLDEEFVYKNLNKLKTLNLFK